MDKKLFIIKYIPKKNSFRKIVTYKNDNDMRSKHLTVLKFVQENTLDSKFAKAYIKNRSIITNAKAHMYNDYFIMFDIKSFFPSINHNKLRDILFYELNKKESLISKVDCGKLVKLCSVNDKGLPLGFVTSPILSNLYLKEFDNIFYGKLKKLQLKDIIYTRFADDLTISFKKSDIDIDYVYLIIKKIIEDLLKRYGLKINDKKTRKYSFEKSNHVRITGISIIKNDDNYRHLSVGRKRKNKLYWDVFEYISVPVNQRDELKLKKIKGMMSFILSVEKLGFDNVYSEEMIRKIKDLGYNSIIELVNNLK